MWTYADYITYTDGSAAKLTRLRLHIQEVSEKIGREVAGDGKSMSSNAVTQYLATLKTEEKELAGVVAMRGGLAVSQVRLRRD